MGKKNELPNGWLKYSNLGERLQGTRFIAFKVPLKESFSNKMSPSQRFTPEDLLEAVPKLKLIINLTNTVSGRYYNYEFFRKNDIEVMPLKCQGQGTIPPRHLIDTFFDKVDEFLRVYAGDTDALIGVHCTHGLNRTGLFICKYMVERMGMPPEMAIQRFQTSRGYDIVREQYIEDITKQETWRSDPVALNFRRPHRDFIDRKRTDNHGQKFSTRPYDGFAHQHRDSIKRRRRDCDDMGQPQKNWRVRSNDDSTKGVAHQNRDSVNRRRRDCNDQRSERKQPQQNLGSNDGFAHQHRDSINRRRRDCDDQGQERRPQQNLEIRPNNVSTKGSAHQHRDSAKRRHRDNGLTTKYPRKEYRPPHMRSSDRRPKSGGYSSPLDNCYN